ncbi:MAG: phage antirepressor KilAC domain-containing protein [Desulfofustis sp.]|jgi:anti-repressor protein|nr:phage antirepressor KilAC domain-containing protein [Desulfofustis sp.]
MNELSIFNYGKDEVRTVLIDGEPWFVAKDVAETLGYKWNGNKTIGHIPEEWRGVESVSTPTGNQELIVLSEQGLYFFLGRSDKKAALPMQKWVAGEVLPTIRKTGGAYLTAAKAEELLANPDLIISMAQLVKELRATSEQQRKQIEADRPKTIFADAVSTSHTSILVGELAKILKQNGIEIGQNRLFDWLRDNGYLIKRHGADRNMPTQYAMELGLFEIKERAINDPNGSVRITKTVKVTGKGQVFFVNKFLAKAGKEAFSLIPA